MAGISPERFAELMREIAETVDSRIDAEDRHIAADALMMETLRQLGYTEGVEVFRNMTKWYA